VSPSDGGATSPSDGATIAATDLGGTGDGGTLVSFTKDVIPIFTKRGCIACHSGDNPGADEGNLAFTGSPMRIYNELTQGLSPNLDITRIDLKAPAKSLLLAMPSPNPPISHPVVVFATTADPDYQTILKWIEQGAKLN
jgi:hypothetical protein